MRTHRSRAMWVAMAMAGAAGCMAANTLNDGKSGGAGATGEPSFPATDTSGATPGTNVDTPSGASTGASPNQPATQPNTAPVGGVTQQPNVASPNTTAPVYPDATGPEPSGTVTTQGNLTFDDRFRYALVGRFDTRNPKQIRFNFSGSKIGVAFTGTSLAIKLTDSAADTFDVVIDGVEYASPGKAFFVDSSAPLVPCLPTAQVPAWNGNDYPGCVLGVPSRDASVPTTYPIATGLADGNHVAWLTKRSEFAQGGSTGAGTTTLWGFSLAPGGKLLPPPPYLTRRLEFIGDSSTSGYGAAQRSPCTYTSRNCDGGRDLPTTLSAYLRAERVNLSVSGEGAYYSYYDQNNGHRLSVVYRQTLGFNKGLPYDFSRDHVDAVVLSAGGDDLWGASGDGYFNNADPSDKTPPRDNFVAAYTAFLKDIRSVRPDAVIFATMTFAASGNDIGTLGGALQDAVAARQAAGDANVLYYTYFPAGDPVRNPNGYASVHDAVWALNLWYGCSGHPSPGISSYLTGLLGPFIAQRMGWTDVVPVP